MVEWQKQLDLIFGSLSDATRRDMLKRVGKEPLSVSDIAQWYNLTFAWVSKHLMILEKAKLIVKRRKGKQQMVEAAPDTMKLAEEFLHSYEQMRNDRFDALEVYLKSNP